MGPVPNYSIALPPAVGYSAIILLTWIGRGLEETFFPLLLLNS